MRNSTAEEQKTGLYFPCLTGIVRHDKAFGWQASTKIEFSAPKLLHCNNLDELTDADFPVVVKTLHERVNQMGLRVSLEDLEGATVAAVHYSKNIVLRGGYTAQYAIAELGKVNIPTRFDVSRMQYKDDGKSLYFYSKRHTFVLYDKKADLLQRKGRAVDKDQVPGQKELVLRLSPTAEVLRLEVRLMQKPKLNSVLKRLGFAEKPRFRDVFSAEKSRAVLTLYWGDMVAKNGLGLFVSSPNSKDLLRQISLVRPHTKSKELIYLTGLLTLARESNGTRELRSILAPRIDNRTWYRHAADLRKLSVDMQALQPREWYTQVVMQLSRYPPVRLKDLLKK